MHNLKESYERIMEVLRSISDLENFLRQPRKPRMSDLELMGLNLTSEYLGIDSEHDLFKRLPDSISIKIERSVYNRRRRKLFVHLEHISNLLAHRFNEFEDVFIVDSMPLEVCKLSRSNRSKICKEQLHSSPDKGYCASQASTYYGYKLHATCSAEGIFQSIDITPASVHDIHYLKDIKQQMNDCTLIGDKGYLSARSQLDLFNTCNIQLNTPMRNNQKEYRQQPYVFKKSRKRIETLFSQLCDQFMIRRNYAKSFDGFRTRILSKITEMTVIQYINKYILNRKTNNIKNSII